MKTKKKTKIVKKNKKSKNKKSLLKKIKLFFKNDKNNYSFLEVLMITLFSLMVGAIACLSILAIVFKGKNYFKLSKELEKFIDAYETITNNYYGEINNDELISAAINGLVSSVGDAYTNYAESDMAESFGEYVNGEYHGIGCLILQYNNSLLILEVYDDTPASKAGLKVNDELISVDGVMATEGIQKVSDYIQKTATGKMKIKVKRDGKELEFELNRGKVEVPQVDSKIYEMNNKKIGYISISMFTSNVDRQFKKELDELEKENIDSLVIDVRGNSGGYLSAVTEIINLFMKKGTPIYQVKKNDKTTIIKDDTKASRNYPVAVLVDSASASASELLAAAFKENYHGFIVGTKTFGKGTVQQVKKLSDGSMIKYTIENWLSPDGNWIDKEGVIPTNEVILGDDYLKKPSDETDSQLQEALKLVSN